MGKNKPRKIWFLHGVGFIFILSIVGIFIVSNNMLQVSAYNLKVDNLPASFAGFKIVHLSDLHSKKFGQNSQRLMRAVEKESPHIVVMTGDMVSTEDKNFEVFFSVAEQIADRFEAFYIVGNHEQNLSEERLDALYQTLDRLGVHVLDNDKYLLKRGKDRIEIYGLWFNLRYYSDQTNAYVKENPDEYYFDCEKMDKIMGREDGRTYRILLTHNPAFFPTYAEWGADLTLCGHIHGGVLRLPFLGGVFSPERTWFPKYDAGQFEIDHRRMIVSRGLGNGRIGIRFLNRPEVCLITLFTK